MSLDLPSLIHPVRFLIRFCSQIYLPIYAAFLYGFAVLKVYALFTLHRTGWATRKDESEDEPVSEGQHCIIEVPAANKPELVVIEEPEFDTITEIEFDTTTSILESEVDNVVTLPEPDSGMVESVQDDDIIAKRIKDYKNDMTFIPWNPVKFPSLQMAEMGSQKPSNTRCLSDSHSMRPFDESLSISKGLLSCGSGSVSDKNRSKLLRSKGSSSASPPRSLSIQGIKGLAAAKNELPNNASSDIAVQQAVLFYAA